MAGWLGPGNRSASFERATTGLRVAAECPPRRPDRASIGGPSRAALIPEPAHDGGQAGPTGLHPADARGSVHQAIGDGGIDSGLLREVEQRGVSSLCFLQPVEDAGPGGELFERRQPLPPEGPRQLKSRAQPDQGCYLAWRLRLPVEAPQSADDRATVA